MHCQGSSRDAFQFAARQLITQNGISHARFIHRSLTLQHNIGLKESDCTPEPTRCTVICDFGFWGSAVWNSYVGCATGHFLVLRTVIRICTSNRIKCIRSMFDGRPHNLDFTSQMQSLLPVKPLGRGILPMD